MATGTWMISCGSCGHGWTLAGNWSVYEREAVESRPCPCCGSYTLNSPEPEKKAGRFARRLSAVDGMSRTAG